VGKLGSLSLAREPLPQCRCWPRRVHSLGSSGLRMTCQLRRQRQCRGRSRRDGDGHGYGPWSGGAAASARRARVIQAVGCSCAYTRVRAGPRSRKMKARFLKVSYVALNRQKSRLFSYRSAFAYSPTPTMTVASTSTPLQHTHYSVCDSAHTPRTHHSPTPHSSHQLNFPLSLLSQCHAHNN